MLNVSSRSGSRWIMNDWINRLREFCWWLWRPRETGPETMGRFSVRHAWEMALCFYPYKRRTWMTSQHQALLIRWALTMPKLGLAFYKLSVAVSWGWFP